MQIGEKGIVNLLINLIIYDYGVGKEKGLEKTQI
jgi:hypothetical protein